MTWLEKLRYLELHIDLLLHLKKDVATILELKEAQILSEYLHIREAIFGERHEGWCIILFLKIFKNYNEGKSSNMNSLIKQYSKDKEDGRDIEVCIYQLKILGYFQLDEATREISLKEHIATMVSIRQSIPKPDKHHFRINKYVTEIETLQHFGTTESSIRARQDCLNELHRYLNEKTNLASAFKLNELQRVDRMFVLSTLLSNCSGSSTFTVDDIKRLTYKKTEVRYLLKELENGQGPIFKGGFINKTSSPNARDRFRLQLTKKFIDACNLAALIHEASETHAEIGINQVDTIDLPGEFFTHIPQRKIKEESLFFNEEVSSRLKLFTQLLKKDDHAFMRDPLFKGQLHLFFEGPPGCGKTASAYQLANETGRDLLLVNWHTVRERWIGESEKNLKSILDGIDQVSLQSQCKPVVLFNEAETFLSRRVEVHQSADQGQNAMVSQLLEWMEKTHPFSIVIFTANKKEFLDPAFERRLYSISFDLPDEATRSQIWSSLGAKFNYALSEDALVQLSSLQVSGADVEKAFRNYRLHQLAYDVPDFDLPLFLKLSAQQKWLPSTQIGFCTSS